MLLGHSLFAFIFGLMATLVANLDYTSTVFRMKIDALRRFMEYRQIPPFLQSRIDRYYDYQWAQTKGFDEVAIINDLPNSIGLDVSLYLYRDMIMKVPLFEAAEATFIRSLVMQLRPTSYPNHEFIVRKGEVGREMYFVQRGTCVVIDEASGNALFRLNNGLFFGEIALLTCARRTGSNYSNWLTIDWFDISNYSIIYVYCQLVCARRRTVIFYD
jgi:hypothetical protein